MFDFILATKDNPREAFRIGSLSVEWYGLIIVIGMIVGLAYACWQSKKVGLTPDDIIELFLWLIPLAIVFARLLYVLPRFDEYFGNNGLQGWEKFVNIIAIWKGGITIIGGLLGGLIGAVFFSLRHKNKPISQRRRFGRSPRISRTNHRKMGQFRQSGSVRLANNEQGVAILSVRRVHHRSQRRERRFQNNRRSAYQGRRRRKLVLRDILL